MSVFKKEDGRVSEEPSRSSTVEDFLFFSIFFGFGHVPKMKTALCAK